MPQTLKDAMVSDPPQGAGTAAPGGVRPSLATRAEEAGRPQPVCLETPVTVSGVRAVEGSDKREPFTEATSTVIVFAKGAVLRLPFPLNPGQLLFLTNTRTKKETVCQVVKSKAYKNVSGYVEIEFTEPAVGFWGMRFPGDPIGAANAYSASPMGSREKQYELEAHPAANLSVADLPRASDVKPPVTVPTPPKISLLRPAAAPPAKNEPPASEPAPSVLPGKAQGEAASDLRAASLPSSSPTPLETKPAARPMPEWIADTHAPPVSEKAAPESDSRVSSEPQPAVPPVFKSKPASPRSFSAKLEEEGLPIPSWFDPSRNAAAHTVARHETAVIEAKKEMEAAEELDAAAVPAAPEAPAHEIPAREIQLTPPWLKEEFGKRGLEKKKGHGLAYGAIAAVLVLAAGGGWYYWQSVSVPHRAAVVASVPRTVAGAQPAAAPAAPPASESPVSSGNSAVASIVPASVPSRTVPLPAAVREATASSPRSAAVNLQESPAAKKPPLPKMQLSKPNAASKAALGANADADANLAAGMGGAPVNGDASISTFMTSQPAAPAAGPPVGGEFKPARVLSSVAPVYPGIAKSQNVSGDVQVDALIGADGRVGKMRVISGPLLLQQAAKDAVSKWKYAPATLDGKPTEMHVTVMLRFRL